MRPLGIPPIVLQSPKDDRTRLKLCFRVLPQAFRMLSSLAVDGPLLRKGRGFRLLDDTLAINDDTARLSARLPKEFNRFARTTGQFLDPSCKLLAVLEHCREHEHIGVGHSRLERKHAKHAVQGSPD